MIRMAGIIDGKVRDFLQQGVRTGKVAYTAPDGRPLVAPVWFTVEGGEVVFNTDKSSAKGASIARDSRLALCVDQEGGHSFVQVQGEAVVSQEPEEVLRVATGIAARYVGPDKADKVGRKIAGPGQLAVYLRPTKVVTSADLRD